MISESNSSGKKPLLCATNAANHLVKRHYCLHREISLLKYLEFRMIYNKESAHTGIFKFSHYEESKSHGYSTVYQKKVAKLQK